MIAVARSCANIALVKYWGKRDKRLNLPVTGSFSLTLGELVTETAVAFDAAFERDRLELNGEVADENSHAKVGKFLDLIRSRAGIDLRARVVSTNSFPTASGLASSSSAFSALTAAAAAAAGIELPAPVMSEYARRGSGSAARSIYGGWVEMEPGIREDGSDSIAVPFLPENHWNVRIVVGVTTLDAKATSSTDGMETTTRTSPYYRGWVETQQADLDAMKDAVKNRDIERVGDIMEHNALKMHAAGLAAQPGVLYWNGRTVDLMHAVRDLRRQGVPAWFTIDAGPHVKVLCRAEDAESVASALGEVPGVQKTIVCSPGPGVQLVQPEDSSLVTRLEH